MNSEITIAQSTFQRLIWLIVLASSVAPSFAFAQPGNTNKDQMGMMGGRMCECPSMMSGMHGATGVLFGVLAVTLLLSMIAALIALTVYLIRRSTQK